MLNDGVGPEKYYFIVPLDGAGNPTSANATDFVHDAHAVGLEGDDFVSP